MSTCQKGRLAAKGEVISHPRGIGFGVLDADQRKIGRLWVRRPQQPDATEGRGGRVGSRFTKELARPSAPL